MTSMLHRFPDTDGFGAKIQQAELDYVVSSAGARIAGGELCGPAVLSRRNRDKSHDHTDPRRF